MEQSLQHRMSNCPEPYRSTRNRKEAAKLPPFYFLRKILTMVGNVKRLSEGFITGNGIHAPAASAERLGRTHDRKRYAAHNQ